LPIVLQGILERWVGKRPDSPREFLRVAGRRPTTTTLVACVGDSITHGSASANYVDELSRRMGVDGFQFINAGVNGNLAWNVLQRIDAVIACRPDVVTLLIGTNDVNATFDDEWQDQYRKEQDLPQRASLAWYRENVAAILDRLSTRSSARVLVLEIPMLGEDLSSTMNQRVDEYNVALRELCAERGVACLPLHDRLAALLPTGHVPPPYTGDRMVIVTSVTSHLVMRKRWDDVSARLGLAVLTDHIHLNDIGASVVADLIAQALDPG
jgi:lysophospholipase L1-like esterase